MKISQRYLISPKDLVFKILKNLYWLKQVGRFWNKTITKFFQKIGFTSKNANTCIFIIK